ncbi:hypothetical protein EME01_16350 [Sinorhizobium meliloti]|nr:hypothetical protein EME01_16350 [Sinorhizobium meliloti]
MTPGPASTAEEIIEHLRALGSDENIAGMARFGIATETALGLSNVQLRRVARMVKTDHARARPLDFRHPRSTSAGSVHRGPEGADAR